MNREDIEALINLKIREHEVRVGIISGIFGALFMFGITHAVWLLKNEFIEYETTSKLYFS